MADAAASSETWECASRCGERVRLARPDDRVDPAEFRYVHLSGNPYCDLTPVAQPARPASAARLRITVWDNWLQGTEDDDADVHDVYLEAGQQWNHTYGDQYYSVRVEVAEPQ
jgi:hypothetical protein